MTTTLRLIAGGPLPPPAADVPAGFTTTDLLVALARRALRDGAPDQPGHDVELLGSRPRLDLAEFGARPRPADDGPLDAWLYSPATRVAYAVLAPSCSDDWSSLLREHLHGDLHAAHRWTAVNRVAAPLLPPFDEPGLRVRRLLALWGPAAQQPDRWFSDTMSASVRHGAAHVVPVTVFAAPPYVAHRLANGRADVALRADDRRPLSSSGGW